MDKNNKTPLITIIGIPNSGKSTLFNRIIGERKALIHSKPGMTRDIYKKPFTIDNNSYEIQDSGGFFQDDEIITKEINKRIYREAEKSDLIIFLFDGRRELLGFEGELFLHIRRLGKKIIPVINKVDNERTYLLPDSYYALNQDFIYISAEHNINIEVLFEKIKILTPSNVKASEDINKKLTRISFIGKPNVGKSSIINRILNDEFVIVSPIAGTTRDSVDLKIKRNGKTFILVDNAGIRKLNKVKENTETAAVIRAEKDIKNSDIVIFVIDISKKIDKNDMFIAKRVLASAKPVIIACNKWDLITNKDKDYIKATKKRFNFFDFAPVALVSALNGKGVFEIINKAEEIFALTEQTIKADTLIKEIKSIIKEKKLLTINNTIFNPKYAVVESQKPFFIKFHTKKGEKLKGFDEVYLKRKIAERLNLSGFPIFFNIVGSKKK